MAKKGGLEDLIAIAEQIASDVSAIRRSVEKMGDSEQKSKAKGSGSGPEKKSKEERDSEKAAKQKEVRVKKLKLSGLAIGLDTITKMSNPLNSKVIAGIEGAVQGSEFTAAIAGNLVAGDTGGSIAQAGVRTAFNLTGGGQALQALKSAQSDLLSRVTGATNAGVIFSDDQLQNIAAGEVNRQKVLQGQLKRANNAFDKAASAAGLSSVPDQTKLNEERNRLLKKIANQASRGVKGGGR